jgi:hypothetical protein
MELNDIKKGLYKFKPIAKFRFIRKGVAYYSTFLADEYFVHFQIPVEDMGDADFCYEMDAKLLIRWIVNPE